MPRHPRFTLPRQPHHVIQRGNNRGLIFKLDDDIHFFFETLRAATQQFGCQVHAYVFMTNHVHLLMTPDTVTALSATMRSIGTAYVRYYNRRHARTGTLYEGRFRSTVVDTDRYLFTCHRYIEENPVRAAIVADPGDYRWSSYRANGLGQDDALVTPHERYLALASSRERRQAAYRELFCSQVDASTLRSIQFATSFQKPLGDLTFRLAAAASNSNVASVTSVGF